GANRRSVTAAHWPVSSALALAMGFPSARIATSEFGGAWPANTDAPGSIRTTSKVTAGLSAAGWSFFAGSVLVTVADGAGLTELGAACWGSAATLGGAATLASGAG